jgi:protein-L-isoaspartate(D-aspartate) O-methyltransferase
MDGQKNADASDDVFYSPRRDMVERQIAARGISSKDVLAVFLKVRRERFVSEGCRNSAYADHPLPIGDGQTISQPYMVALMTECLDLRKTDRVLEIGTGCGYQTAILAELAEEVFTIERIEALARDAEERLRALGYANIRIRSGDGTLGWDDFAPYDKIIVTAGACKIPDALGAQLAEGGKLVIPVGSAFTQMLIVAAKHKGVITTEDVCPCMFVPLIGEDGWKGD